MGDHIPSPPDMDGVIAPDHSEGSFTNCDCTLCREKRLLDDRNNIYTPHDMADTWTDGWKTGFARGVLARESL
jgi:hypothetical protein